MIEKQQTHVRGRIDQLRVFSFLWGVTMLSHLSQIRYPAVMFGELSFDGITLLSTAVLSIALLFRSASLRLLLAICVLYNVHYLYTLPNGINHPLMFFFINTAVLISFVSLKAGATEPGKFRKQLFDAFSPVGRYMLIVMYFFGIFHKLNTGWFDPDVSCGVIAFDMLVAKVGLDGTVSDWIAIYGTLIVEGVAIVFLCVPRLKLIGFFLGISFHLVILTFPIAWFTGFTAMAIAHYTFFLPEHYGIRLEEWLNRTARYHRAAVAVLAAGVLAMAIFLNFASTYGPESGSRVLAGLGKGAYFLFFHGLLLAFGLAFLLSIVVFCFGYKFQNSRIFWVARPRLLMLLPLLFVANNVSPLIGLKTDGVISMFSNLHTEGGQTNHVLFDEPPYLFDYQSNLVTIHDASPEFIEWIRGNATYLADLSPEFEFVLVEFTFWDYLLDHPETRVTYEDSSGIHVLDPAAEVLDEHQLPWLLRKILVFKSVDFVRPKICTH